MRKIVKYTIRDHLSVTIAFLLGCCLIISFYALKTKLYMELTYPILLVIVVYVTYMCYDCYQYYCTYKIIDSLMKYQETNRVVKTNLQKHIATSMMELHREYGNKIYKNEQESTKQKRFLSMWVHNMKTPISVQQLLLQRLEAEQISKHEFLEQSYEENRRCEQQLTMILTMVRLQEFVKDYTPNAVNLTKEIQRLINENKRLFIYNHVYPKFVMDKDYYILTDSKWNDLLLMQLISNAIKYSIRKKQSYVTFEINQKDTQVILDITDQGIGIPDTDIPRVFEPFFTGENGRKTNRSSGVGLYFCKEVCEQLGHDIKIRSKEGVGTTITLTYLAKL